MSVRLCVLNRKGGSGKTSTCFHLAGGFASIGLKTLLVDMDPQGSLSKGFYGSDSVDQLKPEHTIANVFDEQAVTTHDGELIVATEFNSIFVCPANHHLDQFNQPRPTDSGMDQYLLREFLDRVDSQFDIVVIDCPPNLYFCSWAALIASDFVLVPVPPEDFGTQGLRIVHQAIEQARRLNPGLRRLGHLVTRCNRRLLVHQAFDEQLRTHYGKLIFDTVIPEVSAFKVAVSSRMPVEYYERQTAAANATRKLAHEIWERVGTNPVTTRGQADGKC